MTNTWRITPDAEATWCDPGTDAVLRLTDTGVSMAWTLRGLRRESVSRYSTPRAIRQAQDEASRDPVAAAIHLVDLSLPHMQGATA